jgi:hypothetical protein
MPAPAAVSALSGPDAAATVFGAESGAATEIWLGLVVALGVMSLVVLWRPPPDALTRLMEVSIVLVVMLVASPHSQRRYFVQLFVPAMALLGARRVSHGQYATLAMVGLSATAAVGTVLPVLFGGRRLALAYESTSPYFFGAAVLLCVLMVLVVRMKRVAAP